MEDSKAARIGKYVAIGGAVLGGIGVAVWAASRYSSRKTLGRSASPSASSMLVETSQKGNMTLEHYRDRRMPIERRVGILQELTWKSIKDPRNRQLALQMTRDCPERDGLCETKAVYRAVKERVRYTGDVAPIKMGARGPTEGVDLFQSAWRTWEFGGGDCDDQSILVATMLALNGITPKFRVTAPRKDSGYEHIYVIAGLPKLAPAKWVAVDTTLPGNHRFDVEVPYARNKDFPVKDYDA